MLVAVGLALPALALLWLIGGALAHALDTPDGPLPAGLAPALGLAGVLAALELLGYWLPIRVAVLFLAPAVLVAAAMLVRRARVERLVEKLGGAEPWVLPTLLGLAVGLAPVLAAGRLTAAALTNDDGTYYITAADRLRDFAWPVELPSPEGCLTELVLHGWYWRTGISNCIAALSALTGIDTTASLQVVTAVLTSVAPSAAVAFALMLGAPRKPRVVLVVGLVAAISAAPLFLGYQHLLGQLAAAILFPSACVATIRAIDGGGRRRVLTAALLSGAGVAVFADGASLLLLGYVAALARRRGDWRTLLSRAALTGVATAALFPFTVARAAMGLLGTAQTRARLDEPLFPQRGWLERPIYDDLATVMGVDPWPPWPSPRPPTTAAAVELLAVAAAVVLVVVAVRATRPRRPVVWLLCLVSLLATVAALVPARYLAGKILLSAAAFVAPLAMLGVAMARSRLARGAAVVFVLGELASCARLGSARGFHVVDTKAHDRLVPELAKLPRGSLLALDGFGAPADPVHDEHRAFRAALLAGLQPMQPGLDGGFYRRQCEEPEPFSQPPARAYALRRQGAETISRGRVVASFRPFELLEASLDAPSDLVGAWAPTHGWKRAEAGPDGNLVRWSAASSKGTIRIVQRDPCARVRLEARTVRGAGRLELTLGGARLYAGEIGASWSAIRTDPFEAGHEQVLSFDVSLDDAPAPDPERVFAVRELAAEPDASCVRAVARVERAAAEPALPEDLGDDRAYAVFPAVGLPCGAVVATLDTPQPDRIGVRTGDETRWTEATRKTTDAASAVTDLRLAPRVVVVSENRRFGLASRVVGLRVAPAACPGQR